MKPNLIRIIINFAKSIIFGIIVSAIFLSIFISFLSGEKVVDVIICIAIISVQFFCTFMIIDAIKKRDK